MVMHHLFSLVLGHRDLSRAGDLFSLEDAEIEGCLSEALEEIKAISCSPDYLTNDNDQAVVEICITRITTAIRETHSIEKHGKALVSLWESCLEYNLKPEGKDEDTPHAKIASDIMSCVLQNYDRPPVMALAVPVAVKFLQRGSRDLCRNMSSYLSLAAIAKADLLADHTEAITKSVLQGNYMLLRVLPSVYKKQPDVIDSHIQDLVVLMSQFDQSEQQHFLRLLQVVAKQHPQELSSSVPSLISYLNDPSVNDSILNVLVEISLCNPSVVAHYLPNLKAVGNEFPNLLGQIAKLYGAVGRTDEEQARSCLVYLVTTLANMEHAFHHTLLLEIKGITDAFSSILGAYSKDVYRMSNSFTAIAKLLVKKLESDRSLSRVEDKAEDPPKACDVNPTVKHDGESEKLQVKIQAFEEKMMSENSTPGPVRRYSLSQAAKEERKEMRFNRSKSLALHVVRSKSMNSEHSQEEDGGDLPAEVCLSERSPSQESCRLPLGSDQEERPAEAPAGQESCGTAVQGNSSADSVRESCQGGNAQTDALNGQNEDRLCQHLRDNLSKMKAFSAEMVKQIPVPEQCIIEDSIRSCVAKLFFSCPMKGQYCLYSKSSFSLSSRQPRVWIQIMLLYRQSMSCEPLASDDKAVQLLKSMWEKTQLKGAHSFETAMMQSAFPHKKKDDLDDSPLELSKVQSVKAVAKKRRDRSLPRAFEIFTESKTYVLKAKDEKNAEEWLQCISVAVAQAKERENRESMTYL
ncbi:ventricular zone-expressed PH domain-containing protein isoform X2 [Lepisosteus oculatus]|uniref:ventricular zone-expressed PH domain-containing protein isoform X2 n=1 Tax=Lepisosteus oculatus TaxID=7918 RepID=UPI0035F510E0